MSATATSLLPYAAQRLSLRGTVQGVGMRPWLARTARELALTGGVRNSADGVDIELFGALDAIDFLIAKLESEPPVGALITKLLRCDIDKPCPEEFCIYDADNADTSIVATGIRPDAAICAECATEIFDPANRRYRHALNSCNSCGPRAAIQHTALWQRSHTTNAALPICAECDSEFNDPTDRRYHSEGINCPRCAPTPTLERMDGRSFALESFTNLDPVDAVASLLMRGEIVAIQSVSGFHLACDASNAQAIAQLRERKHRPEKPLALMAKNIDMVERYANLSEFESAALQSSAAPIVLLDSSATATAQLPDEIAPGLTTLGFMLPSAALHHLIMMRMERPVVMTSANPAGEPLCHDTRQLRTQLADVADWILRYDRAIAAPMDDSVVQLDGDALQILRYGRGYAPQTILLPAGFAHSGTLIASGGPWKSASAVLTANEAVLTPQLGDLDSLAMRARFCDNLSQCLALKNAAPNAIVRDRFEDCPAAAEAQSMFNDVPVVSVQHHHAHAAACMVDNSIPPNTGPRLAVIFDGMGTGDDDQLWGGEFLLADYQQFSRIGSLPATALPGGNLAATQPWRNCFAQLNHLGDWQEISDTFGDLDVIQQLNQQPLPQLQRAIADNINSPLSSSAGRLFDAVAALLQLAPHAMSYEAQAAIALEQAAASSRCDKIYAIETQHQAGLLRWQLASLWQSMLQDIQAGVPTADIARAFHHSLAAAIARTAQAIHREAGSDWPNRDVLLSGGVFQNRLLLKLSVKALRDAGFNPLTHSGIPANDGGLPIGQLAIAAARAGGLH